ncbi:hypothetical protein H310_02944 [Aphanomyces invadans]|uniref:legumain n=1 Tax=Aphanomyces invadans TaxID=157072 RepID=A0A024UKS1_9STRA|nr:hypothetical protein H310_02944 [Aphanomyces invadans]ETW06790.1 hypothetical protein H310_02944 [Aphanomyces invadans]|eukprot:XP_008864865.1 hypothetical protein H310_02944 [Aphanomyces invadans]
MRVLRQLAAATLAALVHSVVGEHWAVIVVGSTGYWNYRHQADACHAYHIVRRHGLPASNIVLMMYDDAANSTSNPYPGQLFNHPTMFKKDAVDVYRDCHIDYRGDDVTPKKFLQVLSGDASAGGKVLKSTAEDRVFVNFVDHGAPGFVVFPKDNLYAKDLVSTLKDMHAAHKFKELVFYMEACESGSMFKGLLPNDINVYATTAANDHESSWGTYCPPLGDKIGMHLLGTCLGDLYSVNWMEDSDVSDLSKETLEEQYENVKRKTNKSHVLAFGSIDSIPVEPVGDFLGTLDPAARVDGNVAIATEESNLAATTSMDVRDAEIVSKFYQYLRAPPGESRHDLAQALLHTIQERELADIMFAEIQTKVLASTPTLPVNNDLLDDTCLRRVNTAVATACGGYSDYSLKYAANMVKLCAAGYDATVVEAHVSAVCRRHLHGKVYLGPLH